MSCNLPAKDKHLAVQLLILPTIVPIRLSESEKVRLLATGRTPEYLSGRDPTQKPVLSPNFNGLVAELNGLRIKSAAVPLTTVQGAAFEELAMGVYGGRADLNQAIAMISYYASSSEPAQVRGKTVYLQYSNRQEIVNNKTTADVAGNVLLVTIEGLDARLVSIDVLHLLVLFISLALTYLCPTYFGHLDIGMGDDPPRILQIHEKTWGKLNITMLETCPYPTLKSESEKHRIMASELSPVEAWVLGLSSMNLLHPVKTERSFCPICANANVFSAFGFVHKITTFEKTAGFQALVQFSDAETATSAKNTLDGRSIPRYLLSENIAPCTLRITYSAHTDLSVKFQSHRSRDYTNPYLPVAPSAIDGSSQLNIGLDGKKLEPESNVLLASIENMQYAVSLDALHMVFSAFGSVQKIAMFDKNGGMQALIQYPYVHTAVVAKEALEGHCIYDGGFCKLHLSYSRHTDLSIKVNNDRSRDYTVPNPAMVNPQPSVFTQQPIQTMGPAAHQYNGTQYGPGVGQPMMPPQPSAGWTSGVPGVPQSTPVQMTNHPYMPPASMPQMTPGTMQMPGGYSGIPPAGSVPPYGPNQM
ncbi:Polypyrimidine tract-binding protein-like protein 1 [Hibiscus syriacus]|uniref:Polypyrimidine tract-binding protein-like protein 1 n=1 Tax=Hibiscus syriacus TaxID=106335 RepID=A0A6A3BNM6_HIBSY|nr:Polypyrimidine tract-binding protein-like protein 1 [Hibiscus syriacus]